MANLYDANGRPIMRGDVLKVFHFRGARRKNHYMFKQALDTVSLGKNELKFLKISHLSLNNEHYHELEDGRILGDYEIVQSIDANFEDRPRIDRADLSPDAGQPAEEK